MEKIPEDPKEVIHAYQQTAPSYDRTVRRFDVFARFGFDLSEWRKDAVSRLKLKPGDTVVDIGCGTGLNFPLLHQAVGPEGKITGVDLSAEMLDHTRERALQNRWTNIELVCADAAQFEFPADVNGVLSTYALILIPECGQVVANACDALAPGGRLAVLDMAWPDYCPLWWRHVLFFLRTYGVTAETLKRRPWDTVQKELKEHLGDVSLWRMWFDFFYLISGRNLNPGNDRSQN